MSSVYDDIRIALETTLNSIPDVPDIAWENVSYSPTTGVPYIKPRLIPISREPAVRGLNPQMLYKGTFYIECYSTEGNGPSSADALANKIIDAFDATTDVSYGDTIVSIQYADRTQGVLDGPFYMIPVHIGWYLYK